MATDKRARIGAGLRTARNSRGLTQAEVARRVGVGPQQIARYEAGTDPIPLIRFAMMCEVLRADPRDLLFGDDGLDLRDLGSDLTEAVALARSALRLSPPIRRSVRSLLDQLTLDAA